MNSNLTTSTSSMIKLDSPSPLRVKEYVSYLCVSDDDTDQTVVLSNTAEDYLSSKEFSDSLHFTAAYPPTIEPQPNTPGVRRYAKFHLRVVLKFMGCKSVHAVEATDIIFGTLERIYREKALLAKRQQGSPYLDRASGHNNRITSHTNVNNNNNNNNNNFNNNNNSSTHPNSAQHTPLSPSDINYVPFCVTVKHNQLIKMVYSALLQVQYSKTQNLAIDFPISCDVFDRKYSFTILLGGTSGCGKSTISALLASRVGFTSVISTDNIRQILRKFITREQSPILWASTYHAGELIGDLEATPEERIIKGYEAQNEMIFNKLDTLITTYEDRKESLIVEGVHLDTQLIMRLVKRHPTCIPFLMYISNEAKHKERFAIRSKYMTLDPHQNKYTKYFKNIRIINNHLCAGAESYMIPQIDNTSVDRSLAIIHGTIFNCLRRHVGRGEPYYDASADRLSLVFQEYEAIQHAFWSSKGMLRVIRRKRSSSFDQNALPQQHGLTVIPSSKPTNTHETTQIVQEKVIEKVPPVVGNIETAIVPQDFTNNVDGEEATNFNSDDEENEASSEAANNSVIVGEKVATQVMYPHFSPKKVRGSSKTILPVSLEILNPETEKPTVVNQPIENGESKQIEGVNKQQNRVNFELESGQVAPGQSSDDEEDDDGEPRIEYYTCGSLGS